MLEDVNKRKYYLSNLCELNYILQGMGSRFIELFYDDIPYPLRTQVRDVMFKIYDYDEVFLDFKVVREYDNEFMDWLGKYSDGTSYKYEGNYTIVSTSLNDLYSFSKKED